MERRPRFEWNDALVPICIFVVVALVSSLEKALLAGTVAGAVWVAVSERWQDRMKSGYWLVVALFVIGNTLAIWAIPITKPFKAGMLVAYPLALAESFFLWWLIGKLNDDKRNS